MQINHLLQMENDALAVSHITHKNPDAKAFPPHSHLFWEILYFLSGEVSYTSGGETVKLAPDTLILTPPNLLHSINIEGEAVYERYNIIVKSDALSSKIGKHSRHVYRCGAEQLIKSTFKRFDTYAAMFPDGGEEYECVFEKVADELIFLINHLNMPEISGETAEGDPVRLVSDYIENHLLELRSVDEIASALFLSRTTLFALFRENFSTTPHKYLLSRRLLCALQKMKEGVRAADAAKQSGFTDYTIFYRAFREKFGTSPRDFLSVYTAPERIF